jgi:hypothetical protein
LAVRANQLLSHRSRCSLPPLLLKSNSNSKASSLSTRRPKKAKNPPLQRHTNIINGGRGELERDDSRNAAKRVWQCALFLHSPLDWSSGVLDPPFLCQFTSLTSVSSSDLYNCHFWFTFVFTRLVAEEVEENSIKLVY